MLDNEKALWIIHWLDDSYDCQDFDGRLNLSTTTHKRQVAHTAFVGLDAL